MTDEKSMRLMHARILEKEGQVEYGIIDYLEMEANYVLTGKFFSST